MVIHIAVCEDKESDRCVLCSYIKQFFKEINCPVEIAAYENGRHFLEHSVDDVKIVFLDIYMPETGGIEVARKIRETDNDMAIIFTTTSLDHGLDGYSVQALQYLVKPVSYPEIENVLNKCVNLFADSMRFIEVLANRLTVRILLKDIRFVEVFKNICLIHTTTETIKSYCSLDEIEQQLCGNPFLRTHRSYIVNMRYIDDVSENDFLLKNGGRVPIRKNANSAVKQAHRDYLFALSRGV